MIVYELPSANIRINRARLTSSAGRVRDRRRAVSSSLSGTFNSKLDLSISHRAFTHGQEWSRNRWYAPLDAELNLPGTGAHLQKLCPGIPPGLHKSRDRLPHRPERAR